MRLIQFNSYKNVGTSISPISDDLFFIFVDILGILKYSVNIFVIIWLFGKNLSKNLESRDYREFQRVLTTRKLHSRFGKPVTLSMTALKK